MKLYHNVLSFWALSMCCHTYATDKIIDEHENIYYIKGSNDNSSTTAIQSEVFTNVSLNPHSYSTLQNDRLFNLENNDSLLERTDDNQSLKKPTSNGWGG